MPVYPCVHTQNPFAHYPGQPARGEPVAGGLEQMTSRHSFQPQPGSMILGLQGSLKNLLDPLLL